MDLKQIVYEFIINHSEYLKSNFDHFSRLTKHLYGQNYEEWCCHQKSMVDQLTDQQLTFYITFIDLIKNQKIKSTEQEMGWVYPITRFYFFNQYIITDD